MGLDKTASKSGLLLVCQFPFREDVAIPAEEEEAPDAPSPRARGARVHFGIDTGEPVPDAEQGYVDAARAWLAYRAQPDIRKEIAYDWDGETGSEIGSGRSAYANKRPTAIMAGTVDVVFDFEDEIIDWKTSERSALKSQAQLRTLAVMSGRRTVGAVELRADGTYGEHCRETLDDWDLDDHADKLRAAIARVPNAEPTPGDHCSEEFCPLRGRCPAFTDAVGPVVAELVPAESLVRRKITDPIVSEADAAETITILALLESWVDKKKDEAKAFVRANGGQIRLDASTVYREVNSSTSGIRAKEALALAERLGATPEDIAALTYKNSFTKFQRMRSKTQ